MDAANGRYVLEGHKPVKEPNLLKWGKWMGGADRLVARTGKVSTVFLGLDHAFGNGPPILFETLVFGGKHDGECERYSTWDEAVAGHARFVAKVEKVA